MSSNFYAVFTVVTFILLSWILFGLKLTLFLFILTAICAFLFDEGREWKKLLPVGLESLPLANSVTSGAKRFQLNVKYFGSLIYRPVYQIRQNTMFDSWNPLQWLWKGNDGKTTGSNRSITKSKFVRRLKSQSKKQKENPLNLTTPISKSTPKSPRKSYAANMSFDDANSSISVLNASGPLLSTPMMPMIKRAVANTSGHNDTFSPNLSSAATSRSRPVRRANTFHFTPTHPVESSPGVLPWVRFGRRDRHSLYKTDINSFKHHNTVRVAPPDPHRIQSPSMLTPLRERSDNTPQPVDTRAVVNALRERRKRSLPVAMEEESFFEDVGQHAKRRRQESSQSTASSASLPPLPDQLPDLSDKNVMMQLDQACLKRPPAPSREAFEEAELDASMAKRAKNTRNNPIISSLSSSKKILIKERLEAKRKVPQSDRDTDNNQIKRKAPDFPSGVDDSSQSVVQTNDDDIMAGSTLEESRSDTPHSETLPIKDDKQTPSSQTSTPNKRMQMEGISKPTRRRNMSLYPGLNTSFAAVPMARVTATAEDYESDREAERQRVHDMLDDVETSIKKGNKPGGSILGTSSVSTSISSTPASSSQTTSITSISTLNPGTSTTASITTSLQASQTVTNPLLSSQILSNPLLTSQTLSNPVLPKVISPTSSLTTSATLSSSTTTTTASDSQSEYTFKPIFGGSTSTASSAAGTSTTSSITAPVSSTAPIGFNPIFPPVSAAVASSGGTSTVVGLGVSSTATTKANDQTPSLGFSLSQTSSSAISSAPQPTVPTIAGNLGIQPLSASTPKPAPLTGFSLGGASGLQFGQAGLIATTSTAPGSSQTGALASTTNFSFGQNPVSTSQNFAFGLTGASSLPSNTQTTSLTAGQVTGAPVLPSYNQATARQTSSSSTPARTLFGNTATPPAPATTAAGLFQFNQGTPSASTASGALQFGQGNNSTTSGTSATTASSTFQFGQSNTSTVIPQSSAFAFGSNPQSTPKTQAATTASGLFSFGSTTATPGGTAGFGGAGTATAFGSGTAAPTFASGISSTPGFGSGSTATFGSGSGSGTATFGSGSGSGTATFGSGRTSGTVAFGSGTGSGTATFGPGTASGTATFGPGTASGTATFGSGSTPAFASGSGTGSSTSGFGTVSSTHTTGQGSTGSSAFNFGSTSAPTQPAFGSTTTSSGSMFGSTQPASNTSVFGTTASQDQKQTSVFGTPSTQSGFSFGGASNSFSAGTQPAFGQSGSSFGSTVAPSQSSTSSTFQFGQSGQQGGGGENKGFNFNASFTGSPFGTPSTPAQPTFGTPTSSMFSAAGSAVPPKPRVATRGSRRRGGMRR